MNGMTKILVMGIGGIGGIVSGRLIQSNYDVTMVTNNEAITNAINKNGIIIKDEAPISAKAFTNTEDLEGLYDIVLLIMKANHVMEAVDLVSPLLSEKGYFVSMQNGIVEDELEKIAKGKIVSSIVGFGGTMLEPGVYDKTSDGEIFIGELDGKISDRVTKLQTILSNAVPCVVSSNIRGILWSKLAINSCINTIGALTGERLGELMKDKRMRDLFLITYREVVETAWENEIKLEKVAANPLLLYLPESSGALKKWSKDMLVRIVGKKYGKVKSSSLQSLERGRKTEIDYLNNYVVSQSKNTNVKLNKVLVQVIKEIEDGSRSISKDNLNTVLSLYNS